MARVRHKDITDLGIVLFIAAITGIAVVPYISSKAKESVDHLRFGDNLLDLR